MLIAADVVGLCAYLPGQLKEALPFLKTGWSLMVNDHEVTEEEINEVSPVDEKDAEEIKALPTGNAEDTWAIYVYLDDRASQKFRISGTKPYTSGEEEQKFINMRISSESIVGSKIVPIYEAADSGSDDLYDKEGKI